MAVMAVVVLLWRRRRSASRYEHLAYAFMLAGGLGNFIDRLLHGFVIDFIHIRGWPVFNVADILLVVGVFLLLLASRASPTPRPWPTASSSRST